MIEKKQDRELEKPLGEKPLSKEPAVAVYSDKIVSDVGEIFRLERSYVKNKREKMK